MSKHRSFIEIGADFGGIQKEASSKLADCKFRLFLAVMSIIIELLLDIRDTLKKTL